MITKAGLKLLDDIDKEIPKWEKRLKTINTAEAENLNNLLDKLRNSNTNN